MPHDIEEDFLEDEVIEAAGLDKFIEIVNLGHSTSVAGCPPDPSAKEHQFL